MQLLSARRAAFTLVEMSIVIAIIGLLAGAVFVGSNVLRQAELKAVLSEYAKYATAANQFKQQYTGWPGDLPDATSYWGDDAANCADAAITNGNPGTCNGNGDGVISYGVGTGTSEALRAWQQLQLAKYIDSNLTGTGTALVITLGSNVPKSRLSNAGWSFFNNNSLAGDSNWYNDNLGNLLAIGQPIVISSSIDYAITAAPTMTPSEALQLDTKMDDGAPAYGRIVALKPANPTPNCTTSAADINARYKTTYKRNTCSLFMSLTAR